jgi:hypothetical protein
MSVSCPVYVSVSVLHRQYRIYILGWVFRCPLDSSIFKIYILITKESFLNGVCSIQFIMYCPLKGFYVTNLKVCFLSNLKLLFEWWIFKIFVEISG